VAVGVADLDAAWSAGRPRDDGRLVHVVLRLDAQTPTPTTPRTVLAEAIETVNAVYLRDFLNIEGIPELQLTRPAPTPEGYDFGAYALSLAHLERGLGFLAEELTDASLVGAIEGAEEPAFWSPQEGVQVGPTAVLALRAGVGERRRAWPLWIADGASVGELSGLAREFLSQGDGQVVTHSHEFSNVTTLDGAIDFLRVMLGDPRIALPVSASRTGRGSRQIHFTRLGHVVLDIREPQADRASQFVQLADIATSRQAWCDYAFVTMSRYTSSVLPSLLRGLRPGHRFPGYYTNYRDQDHEYVPDVFGWQLLTNQHIAKAHNLSRWDVAPVAGGQHLSVTAHNLDEWTSESSVWPEKLEPLLTQGRREFGDLILK
jgi:hypothetical protein